MLDINLIRTNPEYVINALKKKGYEADFTEFFKLDADKKALMTEIEGYKAERNRVSAEIPRLKKEGKDVSAIFAEMRELGEKIAEGDKKLIELQENIDNILLPIPNLPDDDLVGGDKEIMK
jgi:Seryl-tRNA synthetase